MIKKTSIFTTSLSALVIACAMAAFTAQPATAQTAKKLDCKNCVKSKQLKNNGIKSKDIKNGQVKNADLGSNAVTGNKIADGAVANSDLANSAVNGAKVADGSLTAVDLGDGAGVEFAGEDSVDFLTTTAAVIETVILSAPSSGFVIVHANGTIQFNTAGITDRAECSITTGTAIDAANQIGAGELSLANAMGQVPFASTRVFSAPAGGGSATYNLVCAALLGQTVVFDTYLTAIYVPTRY